jgi:hypothetical protein
MTTLRIARTLIVATGVATLVSGCCVTSIKFRQSQQPSPCQTPYESTPLPLPTGSPPTYESAPSPLPSPAPPPAPASASTLDDFGVKTSAFFRSAGNKMSSVGNKKSSTGNKVSSAGNELKHAPDRI